MASTDPSSSSSSSSSSSDGCPGSRSSNFVTAMKLLAASALFYSAGTSFAETYHQSAANNGRASSSSSSSSSHVDLDMTAPTNHVYANAPATSGGRTARRLSDSTISMKNPPSYMKELTEDLKARRKLMEETPPEEVKYDTGGTRGGHGGRVKKPQFHSIVHPKFEVILRLRTNAYHRDSDPHPPLHPYSGSRRFF